MSDIGVSSGYKLLIFDWDGTLVDSIARIVAAMHLAADSCALPRRDDEAVKGIIGLALPEAVRVLYPDLRKLADIERFTRVYSECYLVLEAEPSELFADVDESLQAFREQGYHLAVATGKSRHGLDRVLAGRGWSDYFDIPRCADESASKPHPLMLEQILGHFQLQPQQALMVGDSIFDLQMAHNAGMQSVAVGYGAQSLAVLRQQQPHLAIERFSQLREWLSC